MDKKNKKNYLVIKEQMGLVVMGIRLESHSETVAANAHTNLPVKQWLFRQTMGIGGRSFIQTLA